MTQLHRGCIARAKAHGQHRADLLQPARMQSVQSVQSVQEGQGPRWWASQPASLPASQPGSQAGRQAGRQAEVSPLGSDSMVVRGSQVLASSTESARDSGVRALPELLYTHSICGGDRCLFRKRRESGHAPSDQEHRCVAAHSKDGIHKSQHPRPGATRNEDAQGRPPKKQ
jgi:hypothetical protein